jgi:hypothetical protein
MEIIVIYRNFSGKRKCAYVNMEDIGRTYVAGTVEMIIAPFDINART